MTGVKCNSQLKISLYCKQFSELLKELIALYPEDNSLVLLQTASNSVIYMNPRTFVMMVIGYLKPYNQQILDKDENFFLNKSPEDFKKSQFISEQIRKVQSIWSEPETTEQTKESLWKYFIFMVKLGKTINTD